MQCIGIGVSDPHSQSQQLGSPSWLYRLPVLAATAENQSVQLVFMTTEHHLSASVDVRLLHPTSSGRRCLLTRGCCSECDPSTSLQQQQQQQQRAGHSIGNNETIWTMRVKRYFDLDFSVFRNFVLISTKNKYNSQLFHVVVVRHQQSSRRIENGNLRKVFGNLARKLSMV